MEEKPERHDTYDEENKTVKLGITSNKKEEIKDDNDEEVK